MRLLCSMDTAMKAGKKKYFILLLIRGAVSYGDTLCEIDGKVNEFIRNGILPEEYQDKEQIEQTAGALSKELLYMKFLQGIPVVGAVGGAYGCSLHETDHRVCRAEIPAQVSGGAEKRQRMDNYVKGVKVIEIYDAANKELLVKYDDKHNIDKVISALNIKSWKETEKSIGMNPKYTIKFYCDTTNQDEEKRYKRNYPL